MIEKYLIENIPGRTAFVHGKEYLFFSGYSYLGMQHVIEFIALVKEGTGKYGWLFPSSRISNTGLKLYEETEAMLSSITGREDTVLVSSGFLAGKIATEKWKNEIINLNPSHPAIQRNALPIEKLNSKIFAVDAVDTFTASITDFSFLKDNKEDKIVIVDDSHGFGLIGNNGEGIISSLPEYSGTEYIITYSLSKAMNIIAGAVSCSGSFANELRSIPEYTACTAPSPALLYAFLKAQDLYASQREKLKNNINYFQQLVKHLSGIVFHEELPVFILPSNVDEKKLFEKDIIISSFAYPDPSGKKVQRIVLSALHTKNDLEILAACLGEILL